MTWFLVWLVSVIATATLAERKGRSSGAWGLLAVLLGPLALVLVLVVGPNREEQEQAAIATGNSKKCIYCAEVIRAEAVVCRYCGRDLPKMEAVAARAADSSTDAWAVTERSGRSRFLDRAVATSLLVVLLAIVIGTGYQHYLENQIPSSSTPSASGQTAPPLKSIPTPAEQAIGEDDRAEDVSATKRIEEIANTWNYSSTMDDISGKPIKLATVTSSNEVEFDSLDHGRQRAQLQIRQHPRWGLSAILTIERGQFVCDSDGCTIHVRFDDGEATSFTGMEPADNSSTVLFLTPASRMITSLKKAKRMVIEATFYQEGSRTFIFNVHGLEWADVKATRPSSVSSASDAAQARCAKGATYVERLPCLDSASECFRKFPDSEASNRPKLIACLNEVRP